MILEESDDAVAERLRGYPEEAAIASLCLGGDEVEQIDVEDFVLFGESQHFFLADAHQAAVISRHIVMGRVLVVSEEAFYHEYLRRLDGLYDSIPTVICHGLYCHFSGKEKEQPVIGFTYLG